MHVSDLVKKREGFCDAINNCRDEIRDAVHSILSVFNAGGRLFICGNGGSAADSQHMAAELVGKFKEFRKALPAIALTTDTSAITAIANDWNYEYVFTRQLEALSKKGDVVILITTSGNSKNILSVLDYAKGAGIVTIGLVGGDAGKLRGRCDVLINVGGDETPIIQERQLAVEHIVCELIESNI